MEDLVKRINFLAPEESETIVLTMRSDIDFAEINIVMQYIQQQFPKNKVIALPHTLEINCMETETLINYLQQGDKGTIIEEQT